VSDQQRPPLALGGIEHTLPHPMHLQTGRRKVREMHSGQS
jgi:hypothetical protein